MTELGHLLTADAVHEHLGWPQELRPALYLGAIAPDAHRSTYGIDYRDLHFRSGRRQGQRLVDFLRRYLRPHLGGGVPEAAAFYSGWLCHLCADDLWRQTIRERLPDLWHQIVAGSEIERATLREEFYDECDWTDAQFYDLDRGRVDDIRSLLAQGHVLFAVPPLHIADIHRWRQHVIAHLLPPPQIAVEYPRFLSVAMVEDCRDQAAEQTLSMLDWEIRMESEEAG